MTRPGFLFRNALLLAMLAIFLASGCARLRGDRADPNEGVPVDSAECDALVSDLLAAYRQALTFQDLNKK